MNKNDIAFSVHFNEDGEVVSMTGPPADVSQLAQARDDKDNTHTPAAGTEISAAPPVSIIMTKDAESGGRCYWIPGWGWYCPYGE